MRGVDTVFHAATLHKPHVVTHDRQQFIDVNVTGTLNLLEAAATERVKSFIYTSTTSVFGDALVPPRGAHAAWITEDVQPIPKNIYGVTKASAEDLCQLFSRNWGLPCLVLRTSRFFPEEDDDKEKREVYEDTNLKANEYLYRRVDIADVVDAHILAAERAPELGFGKFIISATTPFWKADVEGLRYDAPGILRERLPAYAAVYQKLRWRLPSDIDRVYVNQRARDQLGWMPRYDFPFVIDRLGSGNDFRSGLAKLVGSKGYHAQALRTNLTR